MRRTARVTFLGFTTSKATRPFTILLPPTANSAAQQGYHHVKAVMQPLSCNLQRAVIGLTLVSQVSS
jgi:hypothetical protein